ncbi:peptide-methionine (S)-S-oxide reductase [Flavobacterium sediminilitoris]|uniref:peptide-methionine (S)-S-oxide reductase n=1 Tax=Flavobacterium sediminilitoris TaxID=2024526 RepID=A0ABY4HN05_9FLAO|nr:MULTISPECIES: peptide-methionine (S)-S-oxide reductase [Flavobacterium]UOX34230.1 peptide-methionine (S)-S-oxide reductase [Flavobacterium sediminilitoris]
MIEKIGLGGSCHWCTEAIFQSLVGVNRVEQGWIASVNENESFSEAVIVEYDLNKMSLKTLIEVHLNTHSCTSNHSMREKYRSAIYYFSKEQENKAITILNDLQKEFDNKIITKVLSFRSFEMNKEEQLNYYLKNPEKPFCKNIINPKLKKIMRLFSDTIEFKKTINS